MQPISPSASESKQELRVLYRRSANAQLVRLVVRLAKLLAGTMAFLCVGAAIAASVGSLSPNVPIAIAVCTALLSAAVCKLRSTDSIENIEYIAFAIGILLPLVFTMRSLVVARA